LEEKIMYWGICFLNILVHSNCPKRVTQNNQIASARFAQKTTPTVASFSTPLSIGYPGK
jgi:hypothetical protein